MADSDTQGYAADPQGGHAQVAVDQAPLAEEGEQRLDHRDEEGRCGIARAVEDGVEDVDEDEAEIEQKDQTDVGGSDGLHFGRDVHQAQQLARECQPGHREEGGEHEAHHHGLSGNVIGTRRVPLADAACDQALGSETRTHDEHEEELAK